MNISGKAVLVTGANRGIGRALVEAPLKRGVTVCTPPRANRFAIRMSVLRP